MGQTKETRSESKENEKVKNAAEEEEEVEGADTSGQSLQHTRTTANA